MTDEPSLETPAGRLSLFASKAPESFVIDTAKFDAPVSTSFQLTIVRVEDAKKVISTKGLIALKSAEPQDQQTHLYFVSDEAFGRRCMEPSFVDVLRALDRGVKGRCRVLLAKGSLIILLARGLAKPEELEAFYAGCQEVVAGVVARSGAAPS